MASVLENPDGIEADARTVEATLRYVDPGDFVTRRFVSKGEEINTGTYSDYQVTVRDGMPIRDHFTLDTHGFTISRGQTAVTDFSDKDQIDALYEAEVERDVLRLTGADKCVARGWLLRTSEDLSEYSKTKEKGYSHQGGLQPTAGEVHVDINTPTARAMAEKTYRERFPDGPGFNRFLFTSHWRTFSPPPQDVPLALCSWTSLDEDDLIDCTAIFDPPGGKPEFSFGNYLLAHNPAHFWYYYPDMHVGEALIFKTSESDEARAQLMPHGAFDNPLAKADTPPRISLEMRGTAYWFG